MVGQQLHRDVAAAGGKGGDDRLGHAGYLPLDRQSAQSLTPAGPSSARVVGWDGAETKEALMGVIKKLAFVGALAAAGAVIAKKVMGSSSENAWESAGGWDSGSSDWNRPAGDAASSVSTTVTSAAESATEKVHDAADQASETVADATAAADAEAAQAAAAADEAIDEATVQAEQAAADAGETTEKA
jgi:hypothetical protein